MRLLVTALAAATLTACAGISDSTQLLDMEGDDWVRLCESMDMPEQTVTCDMNGTEVEVTVGADPDDCEDEDYPSASDLTEDCDATVGDWRACSQEIYDDPCAETLPASCVTVFECFPE